MDPTIKFIILLAAFIAFVVEFVRSYPGWNLIALGLALFTLVPMWDAGTNAF